MTGLDDMLRFHQQALNVRGYRQQVLASNIANADTPNYKARDFDFSAALNGAVARSNGTSGTHEAGTLATTSPQHLSGTSNRDGAPDGVTLMYRNSTQDSVDGNTVDVDAERAAFADNAVNYEFNLTRINQQIKGMLAVIQG